MARSVLTCIMADSRARSDAPLRLHTDPPCRATLGALIWPWWTTRQQVKAVKRHSLLSGNHQSRQQTAGICHVCPAAEPILKKGWRGGAGSNFDAWLTTAAAQVSLMPACQQPSALQTCMACHTANSSRHQVLAGCLDSRLPYVCDQWPLTAPGACRLGRSCWHCPTQLRWPACVQRCP